MRTGFILAAGLFLTLAACSMTPLRIGSAALAARPSFHLDPHPYALIDSELEQSVVYARCDDAPAAPGPAANLDTSLIPSDEYVQQGRRAQALTEPYRFTIALTGGPSKGSLLQVTVPAGFVSDFHSTPDAAVQLTLPTRRALEAAVVHDWLYAVGRPGDAAGKALADQAYSDILAFYGVDGFTHWAVSSGVRIGGKKSFGDPGELRFYNKCYYGQCDAAALAASPQLLSSPVLSLPPDPDLRRNLRDLTVCTRHPALAGAP